MTRFFRWLLVGGWLVACGPDVPAQDAVQPRVADTKISIDSGFYDSTQKVALTTATPQAPIYYTLDGRAPSPGSLFSGPVGMLYEQPITISRTSVLRVRAFPAPGEAMEPTNIDTRSYFFLHDVIRQPADIDGWPRPTLSVGQGTGRHDYEMDPRMVGEGNEAEAMVASLLAIPTLSLVVDPASMWNASGEGGFYRGDQEEAVAVEVLYPDEPERREQARGAIQGHSHDRLKRSLRLKFKEEFGDTKFSTTLLQRAPHNDTNTPDRFDRLILRAGNNRSWARSWNPGNTAYTMDEWYRATQLAMSGYGSRGTFVHLYINGLYWGLYNVTERPDRWFTSEHFGGEVEDWFAISHGGNQGGAGNAWQAVLAAAGSDLSDPDTYAAFAQTVDTAGLIDYLLVSWYMNLTDWPQNNWWAGMRLEPPGPVRFFAWDGEWSFGLGQSPGRAWVAPEFRRDRAANSSPVVRLWHGARQNSDFMTTVGDRAYQHLIAGGGALTDAQAKRRWQELNAQVREAVLAESARWGDALSPEKPRTMAVDWQAEVDRIDELMTDNAARLIDALADESYYPKTAPPTLSLGSGRVDEGSTLVIAGGTGSRQVLFTTDGSDPRAPGGAPSPVAQGYTDPLSINASMHLRTRILLQSIFGDREWSPLVEADYYTEIPALRVSEVMYHPAAPSPNERLSGYEDAEDFEYVELVNAGLKPIVLTGVRFTDGIRFAFEDGTVLAPGAHGLLVRHAEAFAERYGPGLPVLGAYEGGLNNAGEWLTITGAYGESILAFPYDDAWIESTDGGGQALAIRDPMGPPESWGQAAAWQASALGGSPGTGSSLVTMPDRPRLTARWHEDELVLEITMKAAGDFRLERSTNLREWSPGARFTRQDGEIHSLRLPEVEARRATYFRARLESP